MAFPCHWKEIKLPYQPAFIITHPSTTSVISVITSSWTSTQSYSTQDTVFFLFQSHWTQKQALYHYSSQHCQCRNFSMDINPVLFYTTSWKLKNDIPLALKSDQTTISASIYNCSSTYHFYCLWSHISNNLNPVLMYTTSRKLRYDSPLEL